MYGTFHKITGRRTAVKRSTYGDRQALTAVPMAYVQMLCVPSQLKIVTNISAGKMLRMNYAAE